MIRFAKLNIAIELVPLQKELSELINLNWKPHYNSKHYTGDWNVLALRAPNGNIDSPFAELMNGGSFKDTEFMDLCPEIKKTIDTFQCEKTAIRLLNLKKGSEIKEHRDAELAFEYGAARLHIPVFTNPGVEFYLDKLRVHMQEGECWYINANLPHSLKNLGDADRIHLVIDCVVNEWLQNLFDDPASELNILSEQEQWLRSKDEKLMIINSLRMQNTETANRMADEMDAKLQGYLKAEA